ncbi:hypothetical protein HNY73_013692 [Argiope bruennichi]|uniref:Uncharacterized protein n=1 Tax=Argiope bruennichi TaxID=94029 RepID=A0A8T0EYU8_ARGBR|nr:hypothetical protein HNY73_013692 [Argiope bruennichi]
MMNTENTEFPLMDTSPICDELRKCSADIKDIKKQFPHLQSLMADFEGEELKALAKLEKSLHQQLEDLQKRVSEIGTCPLVNCMHHTPQNQSNLTKTKRPRTETVNSKKVKNPKTANKSLKSNEDQKIENSDNDQFKFPPKRLTAKIVTKTQDTDNDSVLSENTYQNFDKLEIDEEIEETKIVTPMPPPDNA